jgi:hypothetical protein
MQQFYSTIKRWFIVSILVLGAFVLSINFALAEEDKKSDLKIFFSGTLKDKESQIAPSGGYNMRFSIYESATSGEALWQEEFISDSQMPLVKGRFQAILGTKNPLDIELDSKRFWLGTTVGGQDEPQWDTEMKPRIPITTLENLFLQGTVEISEKDFIKTLVEEFEKSASSTENLTQQAFLQFLQTRLTEQEAMAVIISPDTLNLLFDKILNFEKDQENEEVSGIWGELLGFFHRILESISDNLAQIFNKVSTILVRLTTIEDNLTKVLNILEEDEVQEEIATSTIATSTEILDEIELEEDTASSTEEEIMPLPRAKFLVEDYGEAVISKGETTVRIFSHYLTENARIFVTPISPINGIWWISDRKNGDSFEISLTSPPQEDLLVNYWIVTPKDEMLTVFPLPEENEEETEESIREEPVPEQEKSFQERLEEQLIKNQGSDLRKPPTEDQNISETSSTTEESASSTEDVENNTNTEETQEAIETSEGSSIEENNDNKTTEQNNQETSGNAEVIDEEEAEQINDDVIDETANSSPVTQTETSQTSTDETEDANENTTTPDNATSTS